MPFLNFLVLFGVPLLYNVNGYEISVLHNNKVGHLTNGPQALTLLEGPHWSTEKQELVYVDIENHRVHRYVPSTNRFYTVEISAGRVSLVVPIKNEPNKYIIGVERNLMIMEWDGESSVPSSLTTHKPLNAEGSPRSRLNDGKCDPSGIRLWAGTMDESGTSNGNLYKLESSGNLSAWINGVGTSNGLAWSLDNRTMYYIDTNTGKVDAFDYDFNQGSIANRRTIFDVWGSGVGGSPDGMTIDSSGNLWVATWGGSKVLNINPRDRTLIGTVDFSGLASQITSAAFGGPNLDILYVTSADSGNPDESAGGSLFEVKNVGATGVRGGVSFCLTENCA